MLTAACAFLVPSTAVAKRGNATSASAFSEAQQDFDIRRATRKNNKQDRKISKISDTVEGAVETLTAVDGRLAAIEALAPAIAGALTALQNGLQTVGAGLQTAAAGLATLGSAYQAVEFGRAAVSPGDADLTMAAGSAATSADIPDDGNSIQVDDDAIVVAGAGATTETLVLRALIRSAESDGDSAQETAGQAGGFIQVSNMDTGAQVDCAGTPNPPGILGTQAGDSIVTPSGTVTNLPLENIPGGNLRTSTVEPTGANGVNLFPTAGPACQFAATPGTTYKVHWSVQFLDIPTSTTPGPTE
jgi:hypothetical protein